MVYFTCNACGEQLKKPSVEKHYTQKCRQCTMLTCIDCLKDFWGDDYKAHNACMSEEQRYSKEGRAGWDPEKGQGNKGENRQKSWTSNLRAILAETDNIDSDVKNIVNTILDHENIPRKKPKFTNFVKNIMRNRANVHAIDKTWDLFSQALKPTAQDMSQKREEVKVEEKPVIEVTEEKKKSKKDKKKNKDVDDVNGDVEMAEDDGSKKKSKKERKKEKLKALEEENTTEDTSEKENTDKISKKKKKKEKQKEKEVEKDENKNTKRKRDDSMEVDEDETSPKKSKFDWDEVITGLLMKKDGKEMKLNKLKKKCVGEFFSLNDGTHKTAEEIGAKFDKKLKKRRYRLLKDKVKLILEEDDVPEEKVVKVEKVVAKIIPAPVVEEPKPALSFNQWEASSLGSSAQTDKFRRLMGIKTAAPPKVVQGSFGVGQRDDRKIFRDLEQGFEKARQAHFGGRCFEQ